jgi:hypothetical protein
MSATDRAIRVLTLRGRQAVDAMLGGMISSEPHITYYKSKHSRSVPGGSVILYPALLHRMVEVTYRGQRAVLQVVGANIANRYPVEVCFIGDTPGAALHTLRITPK